MTADEWAGEEYQQQRRSGCGRSPVVLVVLTILAVLVRKGRKR